MKKKKININFPKPYPAQIPVLETCLDDSTRYITLVASRQSGKTLLACIVAVYWALQHKDEHIMIISPVDSQVKKIYKQIIRMIEPVLSSLVKSYKIQSGDSEIVFNNGSVILFRSASADNSLRGYSNSYLILDECAFIDEDTYNEIIAPSMAVRGKKILFCSTPKSKNYFFKLYQRGFTSNEYKSFKITYDQNPYANLDFINSQKEVLPEEVFNQEYLAEFVDASSIFKNLNEIAVLNKTNPDKQKVVCGIDVAISQDFTVATIFNDKYEMLDYLRINKVETPELIKQLSDFIKKWNPVRTIIETNNMGRVIMDLLKQSGLSRIEGFTTTAASKNEIITDLMTSFSRKEIKILNDSVIKNEFEAFGYTISDTGKISYAAIFGHDDIVMSTAFAYRALIEMKTSKLHFY